MSRFFVVQNNPLTERLFIVQSQIGELQREIHKCPDPVKHKLLLKLVGERRAIENRLIKLQHLTK